MKRWLLITLCLFVWANMKFEDDHIGGAEHGPVTFRYPQGNEGIAQKYAYLGRVILGELKHWMQLSEVMAAETPEIRLYDDTRIKAKSNRWGLADIDEISITPGGLGVKPQIRIVTFDIFFKPNTITIPVEERPQTVTARRVFYFVGEPFGTTGGGLRFYNWQRGETPGNIFLGEYDWATKYQVAPFNGVANRDDDTAFSAQSFIPMYDSVLVTGGEPFWGGANRWGQVAASNYGLYVATNNCFESQMDAGYTYAGGYAGKIGHSTVADITYTLDIPQSVYDMLDGVNHNDLLPQDNTYKDALPMTKTAILPGYYAIGAMNERDLYALGRPNEDVGPAPDSDVGGYTLVFTMSNGDKVVYDFDFTFSFTSLPSHQAILSTKVVTFNAIKGVVREYEFPNYAANPFFTTISGLNFISAPFQQRAITASPVTTYDVFKAYRDDYEIIDY